MKSILFLFLLTTCASLKLNHNTGDDYKLCDSGNKCVKKCCPEKYVLKKKVCVLSESSEFFFDVYDGTRNITDSDISFNVIHDYNNNCKGKKILKLSPNFVPSDRFYVQSDGSIFKPFDSIFSRIKFSDYCLETFVFPTREEFSALVCYGDEKLEKIDRFSYIGEYYELLDEIFLILVTSTILNRLDCYLFLGTTYLQIYSHQMNPIG